MQPSRLYVLLALALLSFGTAQNTDWLYLPDNAPRIGAFVHPSGLQPEEVGLLLFCQNGGFLPMLRLGHNPALEGASQIWVETLHSESLGAGQYWQYDPVRHRAIPLADINAVVVAQALFEGGTLRVRVGRSNTDTDMAVYNFGLDDYASLASQVPCLLSAQRTEYIDHWSWNEANQIILGGSPDTTAVMLYCTGPQQPAMGVRFAAALDPRMSSMLLFIANVNPNGMFWLTGTQDGQYHGDANPAVRLLMHLVQDPPFPLVMLGSPAPFAMVGLGNLVDVLGNLPCIKVTDHRPGRGEGQ